MKILVIQKKHMGDILVSSIVFELLKNKFPNCQTHYLIAPNYFQIVENHPFIDKILPFTDFLSTIKIVRKEKYDVVIDIYSKVETAAIALLSGARKRISFFKKYTRFFYTDTYRRTQELAIPELTSVLEHRIKLLEFLGIPLQIIKPKIYISKQENQQAKKLLQKLGIDNEPLIMLSTFGSRPEKTYPIEYMAEIVDIISQHTHCKILCNYMPSQKEDFYKFYDLLSENAKKQVVKEFDTQSLREYIAVLSHCKALIGNEGGSSNISKSIKVATFCIYSPLVGDWDWDIDGVRNVSISYDEYQISSVKDYYPHLFSDKLIAFIKNNVETN